MHCTCRVCISRPPHTLSPVHCTQPLDQEQPLHVCGSYPVCSCHYLVEGASKCMWHARCTLHQDLLGINLDLCLTKGLYVASMHLHKHNDNRGTSKEDMAAFICRSLSFLLSGCQIFCSCLKFAYRRNILYKHVRRHGRLTRETD